MTTILAVSGPSAYWYLTRASGVVALLLLTGTTLLGVLSANRWRSERWPRFAVANLHRNLTLLALVFIATHVATTIADGYAPIRVRDAFIPFMAGYRPLWLGFGALALDLLLALTVTSMLRKRVGYRTWRLLHWAAYATWPLALVHGLGSGSDARVGWMATVSYACIAVVAGAITARLVRSGSPALKLAAGAATVVVAIVVVAWYRTGPGQHGWAARAGTPKTLLKSTAATTTAAGSRQLAASTSPATRPFDGRLVGRMSASGPDAAGDAAIAIALADRGDTPGIVRLTLWGTALGGGGLAMNQSQVSFAPAAGGETYTGTVVGLDGSRVVADVTAPSGLRLRLTLALRIDSQAGSVTGTIHGSPQAGGGDSE